MKLNLILVIILEISFCLSVFSIETNDVYCDSIDIRNDPQNFEKLRNCTVVDGNVHIILMEKHRNVNFSAYQFPELKYEFNFKKKKKKKHFCCCSVH